LILNDEPKMADLTNFNVRNKSRYAKHSMIPGILIFSAVLLAFSLLPTSPIHSQEVGKAYSQYLKAPSEETRRVYEATVDRVNRPFHILQYFSAICGLTLPLVFIFWRRKSNGILSWP
jgi:hypothetical protein